MADSRAMLRPTGDGQQETVEALEEDDYIIREEEDSERSDDSTECGRHLLMDNMVFDNPSRMQLSDHERNLASNIKAAIAAHPDLDPVSDFMCAQLALVDGDNIEGALARVYHLQGFREEYAILDTFEDGKKCFGDYIKLFPRSHLCFTYFDHGGHYVLIFDNTQFDSSLVKSELNLRCWLGGTYYTCAALCPDFEAVRKGAVLVAECEGYDWKKGMDYKSLKRVWSEIAGVYPLRVEKVKYFNAGTSMTLVISMVKKFFPKELRQRIELGLQFEQRLDTLYLVPSLEEANQRLVGRVGETLRRRYANESMFRL